MTLYVYGGTPDSYIEDRDTGDRLAGISLTVLDAVTESAATGLLDGGGSPAASVVSDANGYFAFFCESPTVLIRVTDSLGSTDWGPLSSPGAVRDAVNGAAAIPGVIAQVQVFDGQLQAHIGGADPHPVYQTQTEGDARYVRTVNSVSPDATGNVVVTVTPVITSIDQLPIAVPGTGTWSGSAWPTRASVTTQTNRRVIWIGNPGGTPPTDRQPNDLWTQG